MEWINVSDRMPEDGRYVLVFNHEDGVQKITFFFAYGQWWDASEDGYGVHKDHFTHWMPLPTQPTK